jgi:hypothetical protein
MTKRNSTEQQPTIYHPTIWRLNLQNSEKPSRDTYIRALGELPDFILKANQILASNLEGNFQRLLNHYREVFKAIQKWIVHFEKQSHDSSLSDPSELRFSWEFDFKPHAEESWALLNLCQEMVKRAPFDGQDFLKVTSATELWWSCHCERLQETFFKNGIFSKQPELQGKQYSCDVMSKRIREDFDTLHQRKFADSSQFDLTKIATWEATEEALRILAEYIAQQDEEFRRLIYPNYIKIKKRVVRSVRNNSNLQLMVLEPDGSVRVGGKNKRGKGKNPSQSKKGFVKKSKD